MLHENRFLVTAITIVMLAFAIRFYQLGSIPSGITWDEAAIGYNGYSVLTTRRDEWVTFLPISFRSFGDYKAPLAIYLNGPFTYLFGMNSFAVRLPFAISGVAAVVGIMLLTKELWLKHPQANLAVLISGGLLAMSPWHIQFTRAGFESGLALTIIIWATYFFLRYMRDKDGLKRPVFLVSSGLLFALSLYAYHSTKLFSPIWLLYLVFTFRRELLKNLKALLLTAVMGLAAITPLVYDAIKGSGLKRADVTVFSNSNSTGEALQTVVGNFFYHLRPQFLVMGEIDSFRHGMGSWGVLFITTAAFMLIAVAYYLSKLIRKNKQRDGVVHMARHYLVWLILGILPAAIGQLVPHNNRALMALPGMLGLAIIGFLMVKQWLNGRKNLAVVVNAFVGVMVIIHTLLFASYFGDYLTKYPAIAANDYNEGYVEAMILAEKYELGLDDYPRVKQILVSTKYGQPVIYTLFVKQISPVTYHQGGLIIYLYLDEVNFGHLDRENTLVVATKDDKLDWTRADHIIYGSDGSIRFGLFYND